MKKTDVLVVVEAMSDEIDIDELLYRLRLKQKLDAAERAFDEGRILSQDEVERRSEAWFR